MFIGVCKNPLPDSLEIAIDVFQLYAATAVARSICNRRHSVHPHKQLPRTADARAPVLLQISANR